MKPTSYILLGLLASLMSCSTLEEPDSIKANDLILLSTKNEKIQLKANGTDQTIIIARVPEEAGKVDVSFTTTAGVFLYSNDKSINELADSISYEYRYARAVLKSDSLKETALPKQVFVTAEVGSSRNRITLTFVK